jgi:hypothetical protein
MCRRRRSACRDECLPRSKKFGRRATISGRVPRLAPFVALARDATAIMLQAPRGARPFFCSTSHRRRARHARSGTLHVGNDRRRRDGVYLCRHAVGDHWAVHLKYSRSQTQPCRRVCQAQRIGVGRSGPGRPGGPHPHSRITGARVPACRRASAPARSFTASQAIWRTPRRAGGRLRLRPLELLPPASMPAPSPPGKNFKDGGRGRTRTYEGVSQRIYSLFTATFSSLCADTPIAGTVQKPPGYG